MIVFLMGVSGSGKSAVAQMLAGQLGWVYLLADTLQTPDNIRKLVHGQTLTEAEGRRWTEPLRARIETWLASGVDAVVACAVLSEDGRRRLLREGEPVMGVYLSVPREAAFARLAQRKGVEAARAINAAEYERTAPPRRSEAVPIDGTQAPSISAEQIIRLMRMRQAAHERSHVGGQVRKSG